MPKIFAGNPSVLCFRKFPVGKKFVDKRGGGVSRFSVENFLSHMAEKFRSRIFYCCINLRYRKLWDKWGDGYQDFLSKSFCLTVPNISGGESSIIALISGTEKVCKGGGWSIKMFRRSLLSHTAENFRTGNLYCCINFGYWKSLDKKGANIKIFRRNFFVSECQKFP